MLSLACTPPRPACSLTWATGTYWTWNQISCLGYLLIGASSDAFPACLQDLLFWQREGQVLGMMAEMLLRTLVSLSEGPGSSPSSTSGSSCLLMHSLGGNSPSAGPPTLSRRAGVGFWLWPALAFGGIWKAESARGRSFSVSAFQIK